MKAHSTQEAWNIANEIFPTDYEKDGGKQPESRLPDLPQHLQKVGITITSAI